MQRSAIAAERFEKAVDDALRSIGENPKHFATVKPNHRGCRLERFPFRVIYRIEAHRILVVAIAHAKRRPGYWKNRR